MANLDELFLYWLDGKTLTDEELAVLQQSEPYAAMLREAQQWQVRANSYQDETVPQWDRDSTFTPAESVKRAWWPRTIAASIAMFALFASAMLWHENRIMQEQLRAQQLQSTQNQQQLLRLAEQLDGIERQQNAQLLDAVQHVLTTSRDERREDIGVLLEYLKTQRAQDNALFKIQLNDLAEQVEHFPPSRVAKVEEH